MQDSSVVAQNSVISDPVSVSDSVAGVMPVGSDLQTTPAPQPASQPPAGNPLDALEELLKQAQASSAGNSGAQPATAGEVSPDEAAKAAEAASEADKQMAYEKLDAEHQTEDKGKIEENLAEIRRIAQTPAEMARQQQEQAKKDDLANNLQMQSDYQINQLGHTKI